MKFEPKPYTPEQASRILGISIDEIYKLIRNKTIPSYRSLKNAQCRIHGNDLNKYYEKKEKLGWQHLANIQTPEGLLNVDVLEDDRTYDTKLPDETWLLECIEMIKREKITEIKTRDEVLNLLKESIEILDYAGWFKNSYKDKAGE